MQQGGRDEGMLRIDPGLSSLLLDTYGPDRFEKIITAMGRMGSRFYFRINTLRAERETILEELELEGLLSIGIDEELKDAAYLPVKNIDVDNEGWRVEADRFAAEAVLHGAHLYAPGVRKCQGLRMGMKTSIVTSDGRHAGNGIARQGEQSILKHRTGLAVEVTESPYGIPSLMDK
ncbi:MAG TPA: PUA domain-containing protein, partial [Candidatus Binatus sp.]|nr:PUA domain-containing protein [Candidatus Binatus sp.]